MKIYISIDMEGLWGVHSPEQLRAGESEYERTRHLMMDELNLVIDTLFENGASEVLVNDAHGGMDNVLIEKLDPRVGLIGGSAKRYSMMATIDQGYDGAIFIGYHPRARSQKGIFDHTYSGRAIAGVSVNGSPLGEAGLNARLAGHFNVPVLLVTGDDLVCEQMREEIGDVTTFAVKKTLSRTAAQHMPRQALIEGYTKRIQQALEHGGVLVKESLPVVGRVTFKASSMTDKPERMPGVRRIDATTVEFSAEDYAQFYALFLTVLSLAE